MIGGGLLRKREDVPHGVELRLVQRCLVSEWEVFLFGPGWYRSRESAKRANRVDRISGRQTVEY